MGEVFYRNSEKKNTRKIKKIRADPKRASIKSLGKRIFKSDQRKTI